MKRLRSALHRGFKQLALAGCLAGLLLSPANLPAHAAMSNTTLVDLGLEELVYLPTTSAARELKFSVPKHWAVSSAKLNLSFQHSSQLIRSTMTVILNDRTVKTIPLTKANAEQSTLTIPLSGLKTENTLKFQVEQHYTDKCEDPVDASLWTNILGESSVVVNYATKTIQPTLATYPAPFVENADMATVASVANVDFVVPQGQPSSGQLQAISMVQAHLGMVGNQQTLNTVATRQLPASGAGVLVALAKDVPAPVAQLALSKAKLANGQWVSSTNQPLTAGQAVVAVGQLQGRAIAMVSANDDEGLINGARYLTTTQPSLDKNLTAALVPANWQPSNSLNTPVPRYINTQSRTLAELGFGDQYVEKLTAPPIVFNIPVVSHIDGHGELTLDVMYSYGAGLNPRYSALEWRLNDRSIANIPLTNPGGQERLRATIKLPAELIKPHNTLVAQFHMMPDKYGFCVDNFDDQAWGKIFTEESSIRVSGSPASRLPSVGLLNSTGFPFTESYDLANTHFVLADKLPSLNSWNAWLAMVGRLGRSSETYKGYNFTTGAGLGDLPSGKRVVALGNTGIISGLTQDALPIQLKPVISLIKTNNGVAEVALANNQGILMQQGGQNGGITVLSAADDTAYATLANLFTDDKAFEQLETGQVVQVNNTSLNAESGIQLTANDVLGKQAAMGSSPLASASSASGGRYTPPSRDYGWLNVVLLPIQWALDFVRHAIVWLINLPILSTIIHWLLAPWHWLIGLLASLPVVGVVGQWLATIWGWFSSHIILGFIAGFVLASITLSVVLSLVGWLIGLITRR
jgi:hypothetical protein